MKIYITGVGGLIGSTLAEIAVKRGHKVWGTDCDNRGRWFGHAGSVQWRVAELIRAGVNVYREDFRQRLGLVAGADLIVHCASQPSHDWSRQHVVQDSQINYMGTVELLQVYRDLNPKAVFVFMSTNKVYGDGVNYLDYHLEGDRFVPNEPTTKLGINEFFPLDRHLHTPFGVSKTAADLMVQEYRNCFGLKTVSFRCGCLTGPGGSAVELQGFLGYLVKCAVEGKEYRVHGFEGFQVRDNIDAADVAEATLLYAQDPKEGIYNIGGGPDNSISIREAVRYLQETHGLKFEVKWNLPERVGDHKWWITCTQAFESDYKSWRRKPLRMILDDLITAERKRHALDVRPGSGGESATGDKVVAPSAE